MFMTKCNHPLTLTAIKALAWEIVRKSNQPSRFHPTNGQAGSGGKVLKRDILRYLYKKQIISIKVDPG